jgi:GDP/UDP-N,N'-diacetylbacillosamine 2-epimerase (hydrolysing)
MKKICIVTSTRAEYGLLRNLIDKIDKDPEFELCLIATGMHLSSEFGITIREIVDDGYPITEKVDILMSSDNVSAISKTMGIASISFADTFERLKPDMLVVLGDRYELLPICACAMNARIPIAHISGGETTEGAVDESIRHCITKMSYLHFPACEPYRKRIIQLGESPDRVFNFGDVGVELIRTIKLLEKSHLENLIEFSLDKSYACVTFHPTTLEDGLTEKQIDELLKSISNFPEMRFIFTKANSDANGRIINEKIDRYVSENENCIAFTSLGVQRYLSCLKYAAIVIGNSSSGIVEAPSFGVPSINIGDRQKGRLQATSIINCNPLAADITEAINLSLTKQFVDQAKNTVNPYGSGNTSDNIIEVIKDFLYEDKIDLKKKFYDIDYEVKE